MKWLGEARYSAIVLRRAVAVVRFPDLRCAHTVNLATRRFGPLRALSSD